MEFTRKSAEEMTADAKVLLDDLIPRMDSLKPKERRNLPTQLVPERDAQERAKTQEEVALNFSIEQARVEAIRCLQCKRQPCVEGCPVRIDIPGFIQHVADNNIQAAVDTIKKTSLLPAICGRVCPQETQCQAVCTVGLSLKDVDQSVQIGKLEKFVADWEREQGAVSAPEVSPETGKKVAVVGSGPAGLVVAADVRREGHEVTLFEAFHKLGGVMRYGIPEFRLPNSIVDQELDTLRKMGVEIKTNFVVGRTRKLTDLIDKDGYDAVFIGTGAGLPMFMNIPGEGSVGVFSANEYLTRANLMRSYDKANADTPIYPSKRTVVLGGGNVAMDAARMALRLGAEKVNIVYRRTQKEMPARVEEVHHAIEEGVEVLELQNAVEVLPDENGKVKAIKCVRFELGEPDDSGRRRPVQIADSEFIMDCDTVIVAIGNGSNPLMAETTPTLNVNKWGNIIVDDVQKTSLEKIYAGGDIVLGAATVILAMGEGRAAAAAINQQLDEELAEG